MKGKHLQQGQPKFFPCYLLLQLVCDSNKFFWNVYCGKLDGCVDDGTFKLSSLYHFLWNRLILQELVVVDVYGVEVFQYIVGNFAYPIHPYLLKNLKP